jgi:NitT/TauT family transport system permease protein
VVVFLQIIPKIAIAPLFIIWFGFGFTPKAAAGVPALVLSHRGRKHRGLQIGRSGDHGLRAHHRRERLEDVLQDPPAAGAARHLHRPEGRRRALGDRRGRRRVRRVRSRLGYLLLQYNGQLETPMVFAIVVLLSLIGLAVYYVVEIIERIAIPWHVSQQTADVTLT